MIAIQTLALFRDAYRELNARKLFWITMILNLLAVALFAGLSPFVLNTHELARQPGTLRTVEREIPAPDDFGTAVMAVVPGSAMRLDLRLEAVMEGVLVSGDAAVEVAGECARCLRAIAEEQTVQVSELYFYPGARASALADGDEEAEDMHELEGEMLDLEPVLRSFDEKLFFTRLPLFVLLLQIGDYAPLETPEPILTFVRGEGAGQLLIAANLSDEPNALDLEAVGYACSGNQCIFSTLCAEPSPIDAVVTLKPREGMIIRLQESQRE